MMKKTRNPNLVLTPVSAGFPNPAQDSSDVPLDLNQLVVARPSSTFYMRVKGNSMEGSGIYDGDLVAVDKSLEPRTGDIIVAFIDGEFTLKHFAKKGNKIQLVPANPDFELVTITSANDFQIWGVVRANIRIYHS
ncbi:MAG TPA: translesion error-prone DNA polymerase V autoproteolytic subunit [Aquirhabdus sp.]